MANDNDSQWGQALAGVAGGITGQIFAKKNDKRQIKQAKKLMALETQNNKELAQFNQGLAMDMWNKTNYGAQRKHLEDAGLNVGLMYGSAGQGGSTAGAGRADGVSAGQAPAGGGEYIAGMGLALQSAMQQAQIENIKANTEKTKVDTAKTAGVDTTEAETRIAKMAQDTANAALQASLMEYDKQLKQIEVEVQQATKEERKESPEVTNNQIKQATLKMIEETKKAEAEGKIAQGTADTVIQQTKTAAVEQSLRMELTRHQIITQAATTVETYRKIEKIAAEITRMEAQTEQGQTGLNQEQQKIALDVIRTEFNAGDEANWLRWINSIGGILGDIGKTAIRKGK